MKSSAKNSEFTDLQKDEENKKDKLPLRFRKAIMEIKIILDVLCLEFVCIFDINR